MDVRLITRKFPTKAKVIKVKRCKAPDCDNDYMPVRPLQKVCSPKCAMALVAHQYKRALDKLARESRKVDKEARDNARKPQYWLDRAQKAVNAYVRWRDRHLGCITCGTHDAEQWHAGHWISVGASSYNRYNLKNIHKQCRQCNFFGAGKAQEYESRLPARIGQEAVDELKYAPKTKRWTRDECQEIERVHKQMLKDGEKNAD